MKPEPWRVRNRDEEIQKMAFIDIGLGKRHGLSVVVAVAALAESVMTIPTTLPYLGVCLGCGCGYGCGCGCII